MDLGKWVISFVMFAMFALALIGFGINFASDNGSPVNIANDSEISTFTSNVQSNISGFGSGAETSTASIINSSVATGSQTTQTGSQFAITPVNAVGVGKSITSLAWFKLFGTNSNFNVFLYGFIALLTFISGLVIWKAWIGRSPID